MRVTKSRWTQPMLSFMQAEMNVTNNWIESGAAAEPAASFASRVDELVLTDVVISFCSCGARSAPWTLISMPSCFRELACKPPAGVLALLLLLSGLSEGGSDRDMLSSSAPTS